MQLFSLVFLLLFYFLLERELFCWHIGSRLIALFHMEETLRKQFQCGVVHVTQPLICCSHGHVSEAFTMVGITEIAAYNDV